MTLSLKSQLKLLLFNQEALVVLPISRKGSALSIPNMVPCGGVTGGLSNTLTNKGSKLNVVWEVRKPVSEGTCSVRLAHCVCLNSNRYEIRSVVPDRQNFGQRWQLRVRPQKRHGEQRVSLAKRRHLRSLHLAVELDNRRKNDLQLFRHNDQRANK